MTVIGFPANVPFYEGCSRPLKALFRYEGRNLCCGNPGVSLHPGPLNARALPMVGYFLPTSVKAATLEDEECPK